MQLLHILKQALDNLPIGITITDQERKIIYTNPADATMHGFRVEDLMGKDAREFAPSELWNQLPIKKVKTMNPWKRESLNKRKDGQLFPVLLLSNIITDKKGMPKIIVTACEDITIQKLAEKIFHESEQRFHALVENTPIGVWQDDAEHKTVYINPAMREILELENHEEMYGQDWQSFFMPDSLEKVANEHRKRLKGISSNYEVEIIGKRRGKHIVMVYGAPMFSTNGKFQGTIATFLDITELRKAEDELKRSYSLLDSTLESTADGILVVDNQGENDKI